jgi:hypothetical protein
MPMTAIDIPALITFFTLSLYVIKPRLAFGLKMLGSRRFEESIYANMRFCPWRD